MGRNNILFSIVLIIVLFQEAVYFVSRILYLEEKRKDVNRAFEIVI